MLEAVLDSPDNLEWIDLSFNDLTNIDQVRSRTSQRISHIFVRIQLELLMFNSFHKNATSTICVEAICLREIQPCTGVTHALVVDETSKLAMIDYHKWIKLNQSYEH